MIHNAQQIELHIKQEYYEGSDGTRLSAMVCTPKSQVNHVVVHLHGFESHNGWLVDVARGLAQRGVAFVGLDRRGAGKSAGSRGDALNNQILIEDVRLGVAMCRARWPHAKIHLIGLCLGARLALLYVERYAETLASLTLVSPSFYLKKQSKKPLPKLAVLLFDTLFRPARLHETTLKPTMLSRRPEVQKWIASDPLALRQATARFMANFWLRCRTSRLLRALNNLPFVTNVYLAGEHDGVLDTKQTEQHLRTLNNLSVQVFRHADHLLYFDVLDDLLEKITHSFQIGAVAAQEGNHGKAITSSAPHV